MSRYTFNPKLDPNRDRNRRILIGAIAFGAVIVLGIALLIFGISQLTSSNSNSNSASTSVAPTMEIGVTIFAPVATPQEGAAPAQTPPAEGNAGAQTGSQAGTEATAVPAPMDPRGKIEGVADFTRTRVRAGETFGYGIQSNWSVGDIGYWNSVMAEQLKVNWTRAKVNWYELSRRRQTQPRPVSVDRCIRRRCQPEGPEHRADDHATAAVDARDAAEESRRPPQPA